MKKNMLFIFMSLVSVSTFALEPLSDQELQSVEGQAGADLSLKLVLNQVNTNDSFYATKNAYKFDDALGGVCEKLQFCHLALSVNNRYVDENNVANSKNGNKLWVVFKGIQGTINIQKLGLDGADLIYKDATSGGDRIKPAIQLSFDATQPIQIRNFGFNALAIEKDTFTSQTNADGSVTENSANATEQSYGYLKNTTYTSTTAANSVYDQGKETGFVGMKMNGNLALQGKLMMFSCSSASNKRC